MKTSEEARSRLTRVLDELGPTMRLQIDYRELNHAFDGNLNQVKEFALHHECGFVPNNHGGGTFIRAYSNGL